MLFRSNDTATTEIYTEENTLSLHDSLPIFQLVGAVEAESAGIGPGDGAIRFQQDDAFVQAGDDALQVRVACMGGGGVLGHVVLFISQARTQRMKAGCSAVQMAKRTSLSVGGLASCCGPGPTMG